MSEPTPLTDAEREALESEGWEWNDGPRRDEGDQYDGPGFWSSETDVVWQALDTHDARRLARQIITERERCPNCGGARRGEAMCLGLEGCEPLPKRKPTVLRDTGGRRLREARERMYPPEDFGDNE